jgi:hypothetical protein
MADTRTAYVGVRGSSVRIIPLQPSSRTTRSAGKG